MALTFKSYISVSEKAEPSSSETSETSHYYIAL